MNDAESAVSAKHVERDGRPAALEAADARRRGPHERRRLPERVHVSMALDRRKHTELFVTGGRIVVGAETRETPVTILVDESVHGSREFGPRIHRIDADHSSLRARVDPQRPIERRPEQPTPFTHPPQMHPFAPSQLGRDLCVGIREGWRELNVRVDGQLIFNEMRMIPTAGTTGIGTGIGFAFVLEDHAKTLIAAGRLVRVLADRCPPFSGYHLCYPSRRQLSPGFALLVDALRYRGRR